MGLHPCFEVLTFDQIHDYADSLGPFIKVVNRTNVRMAQLARDQHFTAQRIDITPVVAMDLLEDLDRELDAQLVVDDLVAVGDATAADEPPLYKTFAHKTFGGRRDFARRGFGYGRHGHAGGTLI